MPIVDRLVGEGLRRQRGWWPRWSRARQRRSAVRRRGEWSWRRTRTRQRGPAGHQGRLGAGQLRDLGPVAWRAHDVVEQGRFGVVPVAGRRAGQEVRRCFAVRAAHADAVPRHHRVSGGRSRRRRVRGHGSPARHQRHAESEARRRGRRFELLVLALGHVQQRRIDGAVQRRVGRRRRRVLPRGRSEELGRRRDLPHHRRQDGVPELLQAARAADRSSRTASRTTARSFRFRAARSWCRRGTRADSRSSSGPIPRHPHEIAFFDRGPNDSTRMVGGGFWSVYWYNGHIMDRRCSAGSTSST